MLFCVIMYFVLNHGPCVEYRCRPVLLHLFQDKSAIIVPERTQQEARITKVQFSIQLWQTQIWTSKWSVI